MSQVDEAVADLLKRGYVELQEHNGLKVGTRVRHSGERYSDAIFKGTGNIERIFYKANSSWEQKYGRQDVELIVKRDTPQGDSTHRFLADYHVVTTD